MFETTNHIYIYMLWHSINDEGFTKWQIIGNINPVSMELSMERNHRGLQTGSYGHGKKR